jgi:hypothetical protein
LKGCLVSRRKIYGWLLASAWIDDWEGWTWCRGRSRFEYIICDTSLASDDAGGGESWHTRPCGNAIVRSCDRVTKEYLSAGTRLLWSTLALSAWRGTATVHTSRGGGIVRKSSHGLWTPWRPRTTPLFPKEGPCGEYLSVTVSRRTREVLYRATMFGT